jgi:putative membrane protein
VDERPAALSRNTRGIAAPIVMPIAPSGVRAPPLRANNGLPLVDQAFGTGPSTRAGYARDDHGEVFAWSLPSLPATASGRKGSARNRERSVAFGPHNLKDTPMKKLFIILGTVALASATGSAMAQNGAADKTFATKAAADGQAEVALGHLATENAGSPQVRAFGERMVTDHSQANQALQEIGRQQHLALPDKPGSANEAVARRLQTMKGPEFDKAYMRDMVQDHQQDVAEFRKEAETGKDPALRAFAQKYLPVLQQHLQLAENAAPK